MAFAFSWKLTGVTSKFIAWRAIEDEFGILASQRKVRSAPIAEEPLPPEERDAARRAFDNAKEEFSKAIAWIRFMRLAIGGIVAALAAAVVGGALLQISPWANVVPIASLGLLVALLLKMSGLARDQLMLELLPLRYSLALELCRTKQDLQRVLIQFLDETAKSRSSNNRTAGPAGLWNLIRRR
jgi:hypothetical protein